MSDKKQRLRHHLTYAGGIIPIGIVLAVIVLVGLIYLAINPSASVHNEPQTISPTQPEEKVAIVIVARRPIERGSEFEPGSLQRLEFPEEAVPPNAIRSENEAIGKVAKIEILQGQIILDDYLEDGDSND